MADRIKLEEEQIAKHLKTNPLWGYENNSLVRSVTFTDFITAFSVMTRIAMIAEKMNHHPEWTNVYNRLHIKLNTHDAGGVTQLDFDLASKIDGILSKVE